MHKESFLIHYYTSMKKIHLDKEKILEVLKSIEGGSVRKKAAKILEVSERTLQKRMNSYNITYRDWRPQKEFEKRKGWGGYKLNKEIAKEIRNRYADGEEIKNLAKHYNVTFSTISRIIRNITYKEKNVFGGEANVNVVYKP